MTLFVVSRHWFIFCVCCSFLMKETIKMDININMFVHICASYLAINAGLLIKLIILILILI